MCSGFSKLGIGNLTITRKNKVSVQLRTFPTTLPQTHAKDCSPVGHCGHVSGIEATCAGTQTILDRNGGELAVRFPFFEFYFSAFARRTREPAPPLFSLAVSASFGVEVTRNCDATLRAIAFEFRVRRAILGTRRPFEWLTVEKGSPASEKVTRASLSFSTLFVRRIHFVQPECRVMLRLRNLRALTFFATPGLVIKVGVWTGAHVML